MTVLILIPARGGSKRLPGKNLRTVGGVSLLARAINCGTAFGDLYLQHYTIICDTDSAEIADRARQHGAEVPFLREPEYARDETPTADTVIRTLDRLGEKGRRYAVVVLLQPTSPLRIKRDVGNCYDVWRDAEGAPTATADYGSSQPNGAAYIISVRDLRRERSFVPPDLVLAHTAVGRGIDINTAEDLAQAERLWRLTHG